MIEWLSALGIDTAGFDRWSVHLSGLSSWPVRVLLVVALVCLAAWTWSSIRDVASRPRRVFLACWQAVTFLLLLLLLMQPAIRLSKLARIRDRAVVLIDTSASMTLPSGEKGRTRSDEAADFLNDNARFFQKLEKDLSLCYMGFDSQLREFDSLPQSLTAEGEGTDIMSALSSARGEGGRAPLAGVVLISDGADTRKLGAREAGVDLVSEAAALLEGFGAPVNTVRVGLGGAVDDLSIAEVKHDDYGFVHNPFEVLVRVRSQGDLTPQVPVIFRQGNQVLATKTIELEPGRREAEAELSFIPRQVGEFMFSVEIPEVEGELTSANNLVRFPLRILRDKVRILYICGNPSWDERFLRAVLKKNPSVDLVSFYILREHWDDYRARQEEVSLIPFPTHDLFTKELDTFDMVIWQNFRGPAYMPGKYPEYMRSLAGFVRERGGAFLMIGGHRAFFGQGRMDPMLEGILPVESADPVPNYLEDEFKVEVTEAGLRHPIMQVGEGPFDVSEVWSQMPEIEGYNRVKRAVPGALVLAVHPTERGPEGKLPIVAVREVGAGRVMTVMTDYSWEWNLVAVGEGLSNKPYQRFWENALRWLLQDPEMRLLSLSSDRGKVAPGEPVSMTLEVLDESYNPTDRAEPRLEVVEQPEGSDLQLSLPERFGAGKYRVVVRPQVPGGYRVRAAADLEGRSLGHDDVIFEAARESAEWMEVMPRPDLLEAISKATGGVTITPHEDPEGFSFSRRSAQQVIGTRDVPLWDNAMVFGVAFAMLAIGWYLRRKWGLR